MHPQKALAEPLLHATCGPDTGRQKAGRLSVRLRSMWSDPPFSAIETVTP